MTALHLCGMAWTRQFVVMLAQVWGTVMGSSLGVFFSLGGHTWLSRLSPAHGVDVVELEDVLCYPSSV